MNEYVPITSVFGAPHVVQVRLDLPWGQFDDLLWGARPHVIDAHDSSFKGQGKTRKRAPSAVALDGVGSAIVVRRSLAERALAGVPATELSLVPVRLVDDEGVIDDDFALLDPIAWFPMDRDASEAEYADPSNPHGSECKRVLRLAWSAGRAPRLAAFRLGEHPDVILLRRDLAAALSKAVKKAVVVVEPPYPPEDRSFSIDTRPNALTQTSVAGLPGNARPWQPAAEAARSAEAFWSLYEGKADAAARAAACASPHYAFWLARTVDRAPADDTRRGALADAGYAFIYAATVDRAPRDDTRQAAAGTVLAALAYAEYVDHGPHEVTRRGVTDPDWAPYYPDRCAEAARVWAALSVGENGSPRPVVASPPAEASEPPVAAREWPAHDRPRYSEDDGGTEPPTHAPLDAEVRSDVDEFIGRGLALMGLGEGARPEAVVSAVHAFVGEVQHKTRRLAKKKPAVMALGCAFGEQLHRALGWQWASVRTTDGGGVALVAPDRAAALYPFALVERLLAPRAKENAVALTFNMLAAGELPPGARPGAYAALT